MKINFLHGIPLFNFIDLDLTDTVQILNTTTAVNKAPWGEVSLVG